MKSNPHASVNALLNKHFTTLNERDPGKRKALISDVYDPHIILIAPLAIADGRAELDKHYGGLHRQYPGFVFRAADDIAVHHDFARISWELAKPGAPRAQTGEDIVRIKEGRIVKILVFMTGATGRAPARKSRR